MVLTPWLFKPIIRSMTLNLKVCVLWHCNYLRSVCTKFVLVSIRTRNKNWFLSGRLGFFYLTLAKIYIFTCSLRLLQLNAQWQLVKHVQPLIHDHVSTESNGMMGSVLPLQMILFNLFSPHIFTNKFDIDIMYRLIKFLVPLK